jgi:hypothetical protein
MRNKQLEQEQKQRMLEEQLLLQQHAAMQAQQQQNILKLKHHKKHQIHQHHQDMLSIKQETQQQLPIPIQVPVALSTPATQQPPQQSQQQPPPQSQVIITEHSDANDPMSVDDHFAKALGDTWKKIQSESK